MIDKETIDRFNSKVEKLESGCWIYAGHINHYGYGQFSCNLNTKLAHRISWIIHYGYIPNKLLICHSCDNTRCVRIDHLWLGNHQQNMQDMSIKNRGRSKHRKDYHPGITKVKRLNVELNIDLHNEIKKYVSLKNTTMAAYITEVLRDQIKMDTAHEQNK